MKALVVEDDVKAAGYIQRGLTESGFSVDVCHDGAAAYEMAMERDYDFYILDVMLPYLSGFDLLKKIRTAGKTAHAIFLTAKDQVHDRVSGLESGADAYLVKPFSFSELMAVIHSLQRRAEMSQPSSVVHSNTIQINDLKIDRVKHIATRNNQTLELTPIEFRLLLLLARHPNQALSRTVILEQVWDINFECNTNVLDVHIRRLRAKLDEPFGSNLIRTVRGVGYSLVYDEPKT